MKKLFLIITIAISLSLFSCEKEPMQEVCGTVYAFDYLDSYDNSYTTYWFWIDVPGEEPIQIFVDFKEWLYTDYGDTYCTY